MAKPKKPKEKDFIPKSDAEFDKWLRNFAEKLPAIAHKVGITQEEVDTLKAKYLSWHEAYQQHLDAAYELARSTEKIAKLALETGRTEICKRKLEEVFLIDGDERLEPFYERAHEMLKKLE